jgi:hypothetical protein
VTEDHTTRASDCDCGVCCDACGHEPGCMSVLMAAATADEVTFDVAFEAYLDARGRVRPGLVF